MDAHGLNRHLLDHTQRYRKPFITKMNMQRAQDDNNQRSHAQSTIRIQMVCRWPLLVSPNALLLLLSNGLHKSFLITWVEHTMYFDDTACLARRTFFLLYSSNLFIFWTRAHAAIESFSSITFSLFTSIRGFSSSSSSKHDAFSNVSCRDQSRSEPAPSILERYYCRTITACPNQENNKIPETDGGWKGERICDQMREVDAGTEPKINKTNDYFWCNLIPGGPPSIWKFMIAPSQLNVIRDHIIAY